MLYLISVSVPFVPVLPHGTGAMFNSYLYRGSILGYYIFSYYNMKLENVRTTKIHFKLRLRKKIISRTEPSLKLVLTNVFGIF